MLFLTLQHSALQYEQARLLLFLHLCLSSKYFFFFLISLYSYQNSLKIIDQLILVVTRVDDFFGKIDQRFWAIYQLRRSQEAIHQEKLILWLLYLFLQMIFHHRFFHMNISNVSHWISLSLWCIFTLNCCQVRTLSENYSRPRKLGLVNNTSSYFNNII